MKWASALGEDTDLGTAIGQASLQVRTALGGSPDLVFAFVGESHRRSYGQVPGLVAEHLGGGCLVGCSASGVVAGGHEYEQVPAVSLTAGRLPGVRAVARWIAPDAVPPADDSPLVWQRLLGVTPADAPAFVVLADPFTCPAEQLLAGLDRVFPDCAKLGGLASGMRRPGEAALYANGDTMRAGAVCLALTGDLRVDTTVAQGCRPIGDPLFVTRAADDQLLELDGRRPIDVVRDLFERLDERDRELFQHSLFLGIAMRPAGSEYRQGDFLIRNLTGADPEAGTLRIGAALHTRQIVQFHLRDAQASARDLDRMLSRLEPVPAGDDRRGALMFSCTGRGQGLYGEPDHDAAAFRRHLGDVPLGGFFCNGEIGQVGGTTFLHGYTSAFGVFRPKDPG